MKSKGVICLSKVVTQMSDSGTPINTPNSPYARTGIPRVICLCTKRRGLYIVNKFLEFKSDNTWHKMFVFFSLLYNSAYLVCLGFIPCPTVILVTFKYRK
jgi:hypothetical protein